MDRRRPAARATLALLVAVAQAVLVQAVVAQAATPGQNAAFAKELRAKIEPVFAKEAPSLGLGAVTCKLPADGTVAVCVAHLSDRAAHVAVVYGIKATLEQSGAIDWTTTTRSCTSTTLHRAVEC